MLDIILEGGNIYDGSGEKPYVSDIGIKGSRITAVGDLSMHEAEEKIDVKGLVISPGFIDIHTHSDMILLADGKADSQVMQGVTTELVGQCGFSAAPVGDSRRMEQWMVGRLPGINVTWRSFGGYLDALEKKALGLNIMAMVGHGAIRGAILADEVRQPTDDELEKMEELLVESLDEGAWGMSTGLEYWPGIGASINELTRLCRIVADRGAFHASHVRNRDVHYDIGFAEVISVGRVSGVRTQISHIQPKWGRPEHAMAHTFEMIDQAKSVGVDVAFDIIPHAWAHTSVAAILPAWVREGGVEKMIGRLKNPLLRDKIKSNQAPMWRLILDERWDLIYFLSGRDQTIIGRNVADVAEERGTSPYDAVLDILIEAESDALGILWTSKSFFEEDLEACVKRRDCAVMSDTFAISRHGPTGKLIGSLAGYGWVARFLEHYVRDLKIITLEEGIRRMTSLPAERIGISDRGIIRPGASADIVAFDYDRVMYRCTIEEPREHPTGFVHVFVNGQKAVSSGVRTNEDAGRVLRRTR